jgi:hypothetical protein
MKIYLEKVEIKEIKGQTLNKRLHGVNVYRTKEGNIAVEPVWLQRIRAEKIGDSIAIEFAYKKPILLIILMMWWPFIRIVVPTSIELEGDDYAGGKL